MAGAAALLRRLQEVCVSDVHVRISVLRVCLTVLNYPRARPLHLLLHVGVAIRLARSRRLQGIIHRFCTARGVITLCVHGNVRRS
jgi:hypothetical protein